MAGSRAFQVEQLCCGCAKKTPTYDYVCPECKRSITSLAMLHFQGQRVFDRMKTMSLWDAAKWMLEKGIEAKKKPRTRKTVKR